MKMIRIYASIPEDLNTRAEKFNEDHPERPIVFSGILKAGIEKILNEEGY